MKTYVWEYVSGVSNNYHNGGAVLIITDGDFQDEWKEYRENKINGGESWDEWETMTESLPKPDLVYGCDHPTKGIWVFEDSGCC